MLAQIQPGEISKMPVLVEPPSFAIDTLGLVDATGQIDNGLGIGQGSVAGVVGARYPKMKAVSESCGGCAAGSDVNRPMIPETDCRLRQIFNLHRLCSDTYATHYDPGTDACRLDWRSEVQKCAAVPLAITAPAGQKKIGWIALAIVAAVVAAYLLFRRRRAV